MFQNVRFAKRQVYKTSGFKTSGFNTFVPHQWCALFYRLLHSSTRHIEKVEGGERDTQLVHVNEATAV
jgi:hypothetical protein